MGEYFALSTLSREHNKTNANQVGPALGSLLAVAFYKFIKALEYETVNVEKAPTGGLTEQVDIESSQQKVLTKGGHVVEVVVESRDSGS